MSGINFFIFDTETTGLDSTRHECIEISVIRCSDLRQITRYIKCETPDTASWKALEVTQLTMKQIQSRGETKESAVEAVHKFIEEDNSSPEHRCLVGHNYKFDTKFCHKLWEKCNKTFPVNLFLDTKVLATQWADRIGLEKSSYTLDNCIKKLGLKAVTGQSHTARADAQNTYILWKKALESGVESLPFIKREPHNFVPRITNNISTLSFLDSEDY